MTNKTTVVNIRTHEYDAYIGREGHGHDGYFGNPFSVMRDGGQEFASRVEELRGTKHTVTEARKRGIKVEIIGVNNVK